MKSISLKSFIALTVIAAILLFIYVAIVTEIKNLNRDRINKIEKVNEYQNRIEMKIVEIQKLSAEYRIVKIARDSLGLSRPKENIDTIRVSKEQIEQLEKLIDGKYD